MLEERNDKGEKMIPERKMGVGETRRAKRVRLVVPATYSIHESLKKQIRLSEDVVKATTRNINAFGVAIDSKYFIPKGVLINITIDSGPFYPGKGGGLDKPIRIVGKIVSATMEAKRHYRLGVQFIEVREEDKAAIAKFVEKDRGRSV